MVSSGAAPGRQCFEAEDGVAVWPALVPTAGQSSAVTVRRLSASAGRPGGLGKEAARSNPAGERRPIVVRGPLKGPAAAGWRPGHPPRWTLRRRGGLGVFAGSDALVA